jgi:hypothetical protein
MANGLYAKAMQPVITATGARRALIYLAADPRPGQARAGYVEGILAAAREIGLPADYLRDLAALIPRTPAKAAPDERARAIRPTRAAPGAQPGKPWT